MFEDAKIQKNIFSHLFWKFSPARRPASRNLVNLVNLFPARWRERDLVDLVDFFLLLASERDLVDLVDFSFFFSCSASRLAKYIDLVDYNARDASGFMAIIICCCCVAASCR